VPATCKYEPQITTQAIHSNVKNIFYACGSVHLVLKLSMIPNETYTFCGS
jgi:hypothetical protein